MRARYRAQGGRRMQHACFGEFSTVLSELRQMLAAEHAEVLDLPPPLPLSRRGY